MQQRPIVPLPQPLRGALAGQPVVATLTEALTELVHNALDAGAREINAEIELRPEGLNLRVQDNGIGVPAASMHLLGQRFASSRRVLLPGSAPPAATSPAAPPPLGYRGEALAAIHEAAAAVEVTSRASASWETYTVKLQAGGGAAAAPALALEQRPRQGTIVAVRGLFAAQPVRRKALATAGLQREADRCREAVLRMSLLRPHITFTLFDRGRRAFTLRLLKGRSLEASVAEFLGLPPHMVAALPPADPGAAFAVSGFAGLPPHGHPSTGRQCLYVNGHLVKDALVTRLVDALFQQCYKPNVRLQAAQGEELQKVRAAANRHAAFVLEIRCPPSEYELAHEAESALVQFRSSEALLVAMRRSLLVAWRLALSNSLLKELEQLEGGGITADAAAVALAPSSGTLQQAPSASVAVAGPAPGGSQRQRGSGSRRQLAGAKHTLASRLVRYNGVTAVPLTEGQRASGWGRAAPASGTSQPRHVAAMQQLEPEPASKRSCPAALASAAYHGGWGVPFMQQQGQQPEPPPQQQKEPSMWETAAVAWDPDGLPCWPLGADPDPDQEQQQQQQQQPWPPWNAACGPGQTPVASAQQPRPQTTQRLQLGSEEEVKRLIESWATRPEQPAEKLLLEEEEWQHWGSSSPRRPLGSSEEVEALLGSWQPLHAGGGAQQLSWQELGTWTAVLGEPGSRQGSGWAAAFPVEEQQQQQQQQQQQGRQASRALHSLTEREQALLHSVALAATHWQVGRQRPQSAPPHPKQRRRAGVIRQLHCTGDLLPAGGQSGGAAPAGDEQSSAEASRRPAHSPSLQVDSQQPSGAALQQGSSNRLHGAIPSYAAGQQAQPPAPQAAQPTVPDFLQPGLDDLLAASWRRPAAPAAAASGILTLEAVSAAAFTVLKPAVLSRQQLAAARALHQVDLKFLPAICGDLLVLVDQHAADERVQLERLRDELLGADGQPCPGVARSQVLRAPLPLDLTGDEQLLLEAYATKAAGWGWRWLPPGVAGSRGSSSSASAGGVPLLTHVPQLWGATLSGTDLKLYLHHLADTCGGGGLPAAVVRTLNSKACRGAIMFGDALEQAQSQELLDRLKQTQLCFSCAHGRPTTVPLVDLRLLAHALRLRAEAQLAGVDGGGMAGSTAAAGASGEQGLAGLKAKLQRLVR